MTDIHVNYEFSLEVEEKNGTKLIGSEIEPIQIGYTSEDDVWDNGPTTYCRTKHHEWWFIVQNGKPYIIEKYYETGDWAEEQNSGWAAYECLGLPSGKGIYRIANPANTRSPGLREEEREYDKL